MRSTLITLTFAFSVGFTAATPLRKLEIRAVALAGYDYAGCFTEATFGRALIGKTTYDDLMTNEKCAATCGDFLWFGTEYGRECYCGDSLSEGSNKAPEIDCSMPCAGDATQSCGGGNRLTTFALPGTTTPHSDAPAIFRSIGCYTEATTGRALTGGELADDSMTIAKCKAKCDGFNIFGVEYGRECFCGNELATGSIKAPETDCTFPCSGNSAEVCGAGNRLNIYTTGDGEEPTPTPDQSYSRQGCYTDNVAARSLTGKQLSTDEMTVELCSTTCKSYAYFGLEYGRECFCGNLINAGGEITEDGECDFECAGDSSESCGSNDRLDMYKFGGATQSTTTSAAPTTTTSSSTTMITTTEAETTSSTTITTSEATTTTSSPEPTTTTTTTSTTTTPEPTTTTSTTSSMTTTPEPTTTTTSSTTTMTTTSTTTTTTTTSTTTTSTTTTTTQVPIPTECAAISNNRILNPSFESVSVGDDIPSWIKVISGPQGSITVNRAAGLCGAQSAMFRAGLGGPSTTGRIDQRFSGLTTGRQYRVTGYSRRLNLSTSNCQIVIYQTNPDFQNRLTLVSTLTGSAWVKLTGLWTASSEGGYMQVIVNCAGREDVLLDQMSLSAV